MNDRNPLMMQLHWLINIQHYLDRIIERQQFAVATTKEQQVTFLLACKFESPIMIVRVLTAFSVFHADIML